MPSGAVLGQFERRLVELGCPAGRVRREVRELAEHHEDLKQNAREEGLSEADAEVRADKLLGEPVALAEYAAAALRQSSWWGRHPVVGFCLLPPVAILLLLTLGLGLDSLVGKLYFTPEQLAVLADGAPGLKLVSVSFESTYYVVFTLTAILFSGLARWAGAGLRWALVACAMCALHRISFYLNVEPHQVSLGYGSHPNWIFPLIPLLVAGVACVWQWRAEICLRPLFVDEKAWRAKIAAAKLARRRANFPQRVWLTPTSVIAALAVAGAVSLVWWVWANMQRDRARARELLTHAWPAERAAARERIAARQVNDETAGASTIDLTRFVNATLADSLSPGKGINNLAELPMGRHIFGGVPFDVEGRMQLVGRRLADTPKLWPERVRNIPIGRRCDKIHLLHGAVSASGVGIPLRVAGLVLHYADGSQAEIAINAGEQVRDWWGPLNTKGATGERSNGLAEGTELAWAGSNPRIREQKPEASLRLYKSTFANPHPELEIASLDYISTVTDTAPFMVGLTVE